MNRNNFWPGIYLVLCFFISSCSNDDDFKDVDGLAPTVALSSENVKTEPGRKFKISGTITDKDGLRSIQLVNKDLYLNKTIELHRDSVIYEYVLDYNFTAEDTLSTEDSYSIKVIATDLGGRTTQKELQVSMDGDFVAPSFTVSPDDSLTVLIKKETRLKVNFTVIDNKELDTVQINIPALNYSRKITDFTDKGTTLAYSEYISLPSKTGSYNLSIDATDATGLKTSIKSVVVVSEMPDFSNMYLIDVEDVSKLNSDIFGVPVLINHVGKYQYQAHYYAQKAGVKIRFAPQKTDFNPICFGKDPDDAAKFTDDPDFSEPIVLEEKGYYEIKFNIEEATYSVSKYTPDDDPVAIGSPLYLNGTDGESIPLQIGLIGSGIPEAGDWSPSSPLVLNQDTDNPYLFSVEMELTADNTISFIIGPKHTWGWWPEPYWRWDNGDDPEANVANGGKNPGSWEIKKTGTYRFEFDTHLLRSRLYLVD